MRLLSNNLGMYRGHLNRNILTLINRRPSGETKSKISIRGIYPAAMAAFINSKHGLWETDSTTDLTVRRRGNDDRDV